MITRIRAQRLLLSSWLAVAPLLASQAQVSIQPTGPVVIRNVNVVDVAAGQIITNQQVVIRGECIDAVGQRVPAGGAVRVIDGRGKFLIPGLCDAHSYALASATQTPAALAQYLLSGVTSVRDVSSARPYAELAATAQSVETGTLPGPHLLLAGATVDGPASTTVGARVAQSREQGRAQAQQLLAEGWASLRVGALLPAAAYAGVAEVAAQRHLPLMGLVPESMTIEGALNAGQRGIEYLDKLLLTCAPQEAQFVAERAALLAQDPAGLRDLRARQQAAINAAFTPGRCAQLADALVRHRVFVVPLLGLDAAAPATPLAEATAHAPTDSTTRALHQQLVAMLYHGGVRLVAGSAAGATAYPVSCGTGLLQEVERLVSAGLPPADALLAATLTPATLLGRQTQLGQVAPNQQADLVLLDANPLDDIRNLRRVHAVIVQGRIYDRTALDTLAALATLRTASQR